MTEVKPRVYDAVVDALRLETFAQWLRAHSVGDVAGYCARPGRCPVAQYLTDTTPADGVCVTSYDVLFEHTDEDEQNWVRLPDWARVFIVTVDKQRKGFCNKDVPVTYGECLRILDTIA